MTLQSDIEKIRHILAANDTSLCDKLDEIIEKARMYEVVRNESCDDDIVRLADDGSVFLLKGAELDSAIALFSSKNL